jgi:hypothetical protein
VIDEFLKSKMREGKEPKKVLKEFLHEPGSMLRIIEELERTAIAAGAPDDVVQVIPSMVVCNWGRPKQHVVN